MGYEVWVDEVGADLEFVVLWDGGTTVGVMAAVCTYLAMRSGVPSEDQPRIVSAFMRSGDELVRVYPTVRRMPGDRVEVRFNLDKYRSPHGPVVARGWYRVT
ncbi:hypothetical protein E1091_00290 [Micromonospora fluostatini]|uniref:Uncharacterized protein n=1 Tax=Micromonospora fluostatini TaxID=1629071 RepID=A0ABY2DMW3_9ACTN|nr:hypothetical protein E1091_00290 [Micromonospora fluostatini]